MNTQSILPLKELETNPKTKSDRFVLQECLIKESIEQGVPIKKILEDNGLKNSDLEYLSNKVLKPTKPNFSFQNFTTTFEEKIPVVSFFSGAGGLDLGLEKANFQSKLLFEHNQTFCETLRLNFKNAQVVGPPHFRGDMSDSDDIISTLNNFKIPKNFDGLFVGGPPCQPFSIAANQRFNKTGNKFKRTGFQHQTNGGLLFNYIDLIIEFKPRVFLIENVPGLRDIDGGEQLNLVYEKLKSVGYFVHKPMILEASDFGVPQSRKRLFILGSLEGEFDFQIPLQNQKQRCIDHIFDIKDGCSNHETREHSASSIQRYMYIDYGQREKLGRVDRLDPLKPSKTVIAGGSGGGGRSHLHPTIPRTLSPRECARLQTFPDNFTFCGPNARQFNQIGNAVPPLLSAQIAEYVIRPIFSR
jgi:DNA (cytosine-5)-methyltransferase 1